MEVEMRFDKKVAIVTAAANGIGKAASKIFAKEGARLVAVDINSQGLEELTKEIEDEGGTIIPVEVNVLENQPVNELAEFVISRFNKIDILVNAVGGSTIIPNSTSTVDNLSLDDWDKIIQFNLKGTFLCTSVIIKQMKKQGHGKIVNISSDAAHSMGDPSSAYVAAKAGVMAFTKKIAREAGPYGVNCNAIAPSVTLSERVGPRWKQRSEKNKEQILQEIPLRRVSLPEDQAKVIAFLASEDSDYVTGVTIDTSGGRY
jgi:NAD(P)-dependent dehydrogenase (short-subunit alcohol dehydrogenase family)